MKKKVWVVPKGTSTISVLENQKIEMFQWGLFEDTKAEGGRLVKEADFKALKKFKQRKFSFTTLLLLWQFSH